MIRTRDLDRGGKECVKIKMVHVFFYERDMSFFAVCLGCEWNQKYEITDPQSGKKIYKAGEGLHP